MWPQSKPLKSNVLKKKVTEVKKRKYYLISSNYALGMKVYIYMKFNRFFN